MLAPELAVAAGHSAMTDGRMHECTAPLRPAQRIDVSDQIVIQLDLNRMRKT
jgi:hypothetical protein